jgi:amidase
LARSVADLELLLRVIAGPDGRAWEVAPVSVDPLPALDPRSLRVAWSAGFGGLPVSADTRAALERFAAGLAMAGVRVEERDPGQFGFDVDAARETLAVISRAEWDVGGWRELDPAPGAEPAPTLHAYILALTRRDALIGAFQRLLDVFDAFICPVAPGPAFEHCPKGSAIALDGASIPYRAVASFAYPLSLLGCPVVAVPIGHSHAGLPIGAQVVGPRWGEARLLAVVDAMVAAGVAPRQSPIAW